MSKAVLLLSFFLMLACGGGETPAPSAPSAKPPLSASTSPAPSQDTARTSSTNEMIGATVAPLVIANKMVAALAKNDFTAATRDFDKTMQANLPPDKLKTIWEQLIARNGPFRMNAGGQTTEAKGAGLVLIKCEFEKGSVVLQILVNPERKISGFLVR